MKALLAALIVSYVLPAYSILRRLAEGRDDLQLTTLKVEGAAAVGPAAAKDAAAALGSAWEAGELPAAFSVTMRLPGRCRVELRTLDGGKAVAAVHAFGKRRADGGQVPGLQQAADAICGVLALHASGEGESRAAVEKYLAGLKVNTRVTSLGRFGGAVAYVIGDTAEGAPQFWVQREHFLPVRVAFTEGDAAYDVQFLDYTSSSTGEWFPRALAVFRNGEPLLRLNAQKSDLKPKLEEGAF
ncbi:MAG: hypothetical protein K1X89_14040 [Myxococcaceae bacterium]|nr:hypothetical protein [Myxococcaceae bacterium]